MGLYFPVIVGEGDLLRRQVQCLARADSLLGALAGGYGPADLEEKDRRARRLEGKRQRMIEELRRQ